MTANKNVNMISGLGKKPVRESDSRIKWYELDKWMAEQEKYFAKKRITDDQEKINHIILNLDVRFWVKLENFYKFNQREQVTFEKLKSVLLKKVKRRLDPSMAKYDSKVDGFCDKLNITNLNLENLKIWLKKLRYLCDGQGKDDYLTIKILSRVVDDKKEEALSNLLLEIKQSIEDYEARMVNNVIGKEKKKELKSLKIIKETIQDSLNYFL